MRDAEEPAGVIPARPSDAFLLSYMAVAPFALAFERSVECTIYSRLPLRRPILDLGCGEGLFGRMLFAERVETGVDPNPRELERARELGAYSELIECAGDAIPKPDGLYNTIVSNSVLEHIPRLTPVFREAYRLLAPGGRFYLTVPSDRFNQYTVLNAILIAVGAPSLADRWRRSYDRFWRHYHCYPEEEWLAIARECGFEAMSAYAYDPKGLCLLNDLLIPLSLPALLIKRLSNRWVLFPSARRLLLYPFFLVARRLLRGCEKARDGGLVFLELAKPRARG